MLLVPLRIDNPSSGRAVDLSQITRLHVHVRGEHHVIQNNAKDTSKQSHISDTQAVISHIGSGASESCVQFALRYHGNC